MKLISWNVNGLRAVLKKNFLDYLDAKKPDVLCLQETKCSPDDVEQLWPATYTTFWNSAQKKGYSGTAIFTRMRPLKVTPHIGVAEHDQEGRVLTAEFADFFLVNVYVPNSKRELTRLAYRQQWDRDFLRYLKKLEKKKPVIFCGDLNVAHTEIDLANPQANVHNPGSHRRNAPDSAPSCAPVSSTPSANLSQAGDITPGGARCPARVPGTSAGALTTFSFQNPCARALNAPSSSRMCWAAITVPSASSLNSRGAR